MKNTSIKGKHARRTLAACVTVFAALMFVTQAVFGANWNGIEPLKSRRADVEKVLGTPISTGASDTGTLHFKVAGGTVAVVFVDAKFVASKHLDSSAEGTVRQIVLQHENSNDTPESMSLASKSDFKREDVQGAAIFRNLKEGIVYTFIGGKLKTTYYTPSTDQWSRAQK